MVTAHRHPVSLRGVWSGGSNRGARAPSILQLEDQDFVSRFLAELQRKGGLARLQRQQAKERNAASCLRLYQPVHRVFHLALLEACCFRPGELPLNPAWILGSGLVIRRLDRDGEKGWFRKEGVVLGWQPLPADRHEQRRGYDPDPALRLTRRLGSNAAMLAGLEDAASEAAALEETVSPLFLVPPEICAGIQRTILYGLVPVTSSEHAEQAPPLPVPFSDDDILARMPALLKRGGDERSGLPQSGIMVSQYSRTNDVRVQSFFAALDYLSREVGLFTGTPASTKLRRALDAIHLKPESLPNAALPLLGLQKSLGGFLQYANDTVNSGPSAVEEAGGVPLTMWLPDFWPAIRESDERAIVSGIHAAMLARWKMAEPAQGRFDDSGARYVARGFIRVRQKEGCPPTTFWTTASEPFEIIPWHESSPAPPIKVELPEINRETLQKLRPNVAIKVPPSLQKFMDGMTMKGLLAGSVPKGEGGFGMICSFSIPIITICAFIVLQIFLTLLQIVFWWLPFVKICIPFPKPKS